MSFEQKRKEEGRRLANHERVRLTGAVKQSKNDTRIVAGFASADVSKLRPVLSMKCHCRLSDSQLASQHTDPLILQHCCKASICF